MARARAEGAIGDLPHSLARLANAYRYRGDLDGAVIAATEGLQLARETGQEADACLLLAELAVGAALRGDEPECRRRADEALGTAIPHRITFAAGMATWAVGLLELSAGRPDLALSAFQSINDPTSPVANVALAMFTIADLIEAAVRDGRHQVGREKLPGLLAWAQTSRRGNALVVAARSNALLDDDLDGYVEALSVQANDVSAVERARTELLYGEALRRRRQPAAAREPLRSALEVFSRLGMAKWAERARIELRAAGVVTAHHSAARPASALTTQELQIARLVADRASNRDVAAALFLSPRTVEYHLYKIFPKLGIASRAELATLISANQRCRNKPPRCSAQPRRPTRVAAARCRAK